MDKLEKVKEGLGYCHYPLEICVTRKCPYFERADHGDCVHRLHMDTIEVINAQEPQWTPITFRALTEEEKAEHPDWCYIIDSPTPDDGEEILVSDGDNVWADVWSNNGEWCSLESDHELEGVAWMKIPAPWKKEANT